MATLIVLRNGLIVSEEEFNEKASLGDLDRFYEESATDPGATLEFTTGIISAAELEAVGRGDDAVPFEPIAMGKPLSVQIMNFYSGKLPDRVLGFGKPDLMVTSAVKSIETYAAQPLAVNQVTMNPDSHQTVSPAADEAGSPIVYYTKSFVDDSLLCTISIWADTFDDDLLAQLSSLLRTAGGLPVFITGPQGPAIASAALAGSALVNLAGKLGKAFFEKKPHLRATLPPISFETALLSPIESDARIIANDIHRNEFTDYTIQRVQDGLGNQRIELVNGMGESYRGNAPYAVVSIDGRERLNLENFAPTLATAALLEQFLGAEDPAGAAVQVLEEAMGLYNDYSFHQRAIDLKNRIARLKPTSPTFEEDRKKLEAILEANNKNIRNELFSV